MKKSTSPFVVALLVPVLFAACSRPVAYVQKGPRETFAVTASPAPVAVVAADTELPDPDAPVAMPTAAAVLTPAATLDQVEALVRNDRNLSADRTIQKRLNRVRSLLATSESAINASIPAGTVRKAGLMERAMTKKIDRQITKKFSPQKPALNSGTLATGAVLVIVGLLLLILTTGTAATIGLIALLIGVIALLLGLL